MTTSGVSGTRKEESGTNIAESLTPELKEFYERHNVTGVADFLRRPHLDDSSPSVRFVRLNPRFDKAGTLSALRSELREGSERLTPIPWLDNRLGFYAVPGDFNLAKSPLFRAGKIYGMDVSSGAAVAVLLSNQYDDTRKEKKSLNANENDPFVLLPHGSPSSAARQEPFRVLDLCCAPGLKLCAIADLLSESKSTALAKATVVGVDISENRTALCKTIVRKYHVDCDTSGKKPSGSIDESEGAVAPNVRIRLYCEDGTTFGTRAPHELVFDSQVAQEENQSVGKRKRMNKSARNRERKRLRQVIELDVSAKVDGDNDSQGNSSDCSVAVKLFDRVLVDAECSTDGSLKHVQQRMIKETLKASNRQEAKGGTTVSNNTFSASNPTLTDPAQLEKLVMLQKGLISSGFRLLKPGGELVYSTCSLSQAQNEGVVSWLLEKFSLEASIVPISFPLQSRRAVTMISQGSIKGTIRFHPSTGIMTDSGSFDEHCLFGGGFFLAKILKRKK